MNIFNKVIMSWIDFETKLDTAIDMITELGGTEDLMNACTNLRYILGQIPSGEINSEINDKANGEIEELCVNTKDLIRNYIAMHEFINEQCSYLYDETTMENLIESRNDEQFFEDCSAWITNIAEIKEPSLDEWYVNHRLEIRVHETEN